MKRLAERGFTLIEIMIVVAIVALLAAIAIPNVLRARTTANESAAVGSLRAVLTSLEMFRSVNLRYPTAVTNTGAAGEWGFDMYGAGGLPTGCGATVQPTPDFGPPSFCVTMAGSTIQGYTYTYAGGATNQQYTILAVPATPGQTGTRTFYADQTGLIRHCIQLSAAATVGAAYGANWAGIDVTPPVAGCN